MGEALSSFVKENTNSFIFAESLKCEKSSMTATAMLNMTKVLERGRLSVSQDTVAGEGWPFPCHFLLLSSQPQKAGCCRTAGGTTGSQYRRLTVLLAGFTRPLLHAHGVITGQLLILPDLLQSYTRHTQEHLRVTKRVTF